MITRTFLSEATLRANQVVAGWMREAGLATSEDRVGNLLGQSRASSGDSIFLLGSHLDSVRNAGRFDGPLGVLLAIEAVEILRSAERSSAILSRPSPDSATKKVSGFKMLTSGARRSAGC